MMHNSRRTKEFENTYRKKIVDIINSSIPNHKKEIKAMTDIWLNQKYQEQIKKLPEMKNPTLKDFLESYDMKDYKKNNCPLIGDRLYQYSADTVFDFIKSDIIALMRETGYEDSLEDADAIAGAYVSLSNVDDLFDDLDVYLILIGYDLNKSL